LLTAAAAVSAALTPAGVWAEGLSAGSLELDWRAPPGCPDGPAALQRIRSLLASSPEAPERVTANATVAPGPTDGSWTLDLSTAQGERSFQRSVRAGSCEEATDAGVLIIALAIDPDLKTPSAEPSEPPSAEPPPAKAAAKPATSAAEPAPKGGAEGQRDQPRAPKPRTAKPVGLAAAGTASADLGSLPRPAFGAQGALALELLPLHLEALITFFPPARETIAPERGGDIDLIAGGARGCYFARGERLAAGACGGVEVGSLAGSGFGTSWKETRTSLWLAPRLGFLGSYALSTDAALRLGLEALLPASRPVFFLENVGRVHQPAALVGRLEIGLELAL